MFFLHKLYNLDNSCDGGGGAPAGTTRSQFVLWQGVPDMAWIWISAGYGLDLGRIWIA